MKKYLLILIALFIFPVISFASSSFPQFPMAFYGSVTLNGTTAPAGTIIRAYYGTTLAGQSTVDNTGAYGDNSSTGAKLLVGEGTGIITFTFQSPSILSGQESLGSTTLSVAGFQEGVSQSNDLNFTYNIPVVIPPSSGGGGVGGGGGGGGSSVLTPVVTPLTSAKKGDITGDGKIDILDFNSLMINWDKTGTNLAADLNGDGKVDIFDFNLLMINWNK